MQSRPIAGFPPQRAIRFLVRVRAGRESFVGQVEMSAAGTIDLPHLSRMTFGEKSLQAEVLALFDRQADMLLARMMPVSPKAAAAFAHISEAPRVVSGPGRWRRPQRISSSLQRMQMRPGLPAPCDGSQMPSVKRRQ
jgi:hypothetical protein